MRMKKTPYLVFEWAAEIAAKKMKKSHGTGDGWFGHGNPSSHGALGDLPQVNPQIYPQAVLFC